MNDNVIYGSTLTTPLKQGDSVKVDQTYKPESENAQSGKAVAEAIASVGSNITVDHNFVETSKNPQSGIAVAEAISAKQDRLIDGLTIKTINGESILGYGDLEILIPEDGSGENGATFIPNVSADGIISWTNDKGLSNPAPVNIKGEDGYSPTVAVSKNGKVTTINITDKNGKKTATINDGEDGGKGADGVSATHSWNGTTLTITSASGTSSANLKGEKGDQGEMGMVQMTPLFANSIEECTDTSKLYVLPDGYIYSYQKEEKYIAENQFVKSESKYNHRISGSGVVQSGYNGILVTGLIPVPTWVSPYTVKIKGITVELHSTLQYTIITNYCDSAGNNIKVLPDCFGYGTTPNAQGEYEGNIYNSSYTNATHVRFAICIKDGTAISEADTANLFIEFVPKNYTGLVEEWKNTGHAFVPADYEDRILGLETDVETLKEKTKIMPSQSGAVWYAVGDSITKGYGVGADNCWVKYVMQYNGYDSEKSKNLGISGLGFAKTDPNYSKTARSVVDENDFSTVDMVTIAIGINDWKEPFSIDTVKSEMRYCFDKILTDNPYCKIIFITPFNMCNKGSESTNWALGYSGIDVTGGTLADFVNTQKTVCEQYGIQVIDMTTNSVINKKNITTVLSDGIHPDTACHKALGKELARKITFA